MKQFMCVYKRTFVLVFSILTSTVWANEVNANTPCDCTANDPPTLEVNGQDFDFDTHIWGCFLNDAPDLPDPLAVTAVGDDCSPVDIADVVITDDLPGVDQGDCSTLVTRTYTITDECGESTSITESWHYTVNVKPIYTTTPFAVIVGCVADAPPEIDLEWIDDCDGSGFVSPSTIELIPVDPCTGGILLRTWFYEDSCGERASHGQQIIVSPNNALQFIDPPGDLILSCTDPIPDPVDLVYDSDPINPTCVVPGTVSPTDSGILSSCGDAITRTWHYMSPCGVEITHVQNIEIQDNDAPVLSEMPSDITITCISDLPPVPNVTWTDECDGSGTANVTDTPTINGCNGGNVERVIEYTDVCGNVATHTQMIIIDPVPAVQWTSTLPTDISISCGETVPTSIDLDYSNGLEGTPCGVAGTATYTDSGSINLCGDQITRTWTVAADAANCVSELVFSITITLDDNQAPNFINLPAAAVTVACAGDIPAAQDLDWEDDCDGSGSVGFTESGSADICDGGTITREWTYTDACGNGPITFTQVYTIDAIPFTSCDDGDDCTEGDMQKLDCNGGICVPCQGVPTDCSGVVTFVSCDDGSPCTENDEQGLACDGSECVPCQGTPIATCLGVVPNVVLTCDDGDPCTINDMYEVDGCDMTTECVPCQGTYNPTPDPTPDTNSIGCADETTTLSYTACTGVVTWYDAAGGNVLHVGDTYETDVLTGNTSFFVTCSIDNCESAPVEMPVMVVTPTPVNITGPDMICNGQETITLTADAGYDIYDWGAGPATADFDVSMPGDYSVTVTDSNGCTSEETFTVNASTLPTVTIAGANSFCIGFSSTLEVPNTFASYVWAPNGETSNTAEANSAGTYSVTVTDSNGCTGEASLEITEAAGLMPTITGNLVYCEGESTDLSIGSGYANIEWSSGESLETITISSPGTISVTVSDADGCSGETSVEVMENSNPTPTITGDVLICENSMATLSAGAGFDNYSWSDGSNGQDLDINGPGNYSVTVTDSNGCTGTDEFTVDESPDPMVEVTGDLLLCSGGGDMVSLTATPGYVSYNWAPGTSSTNVLDVTDPNTYSVTVTDVNGCTAVATADVNLDTPPVVSIDGNVQFCSGFDTNLTATTGFANYEWSSGEGGEAIVVNAGGTYTVTVTDGSGCTNTAEVIVVELSELMPEIVGDLDICPGGAEDVELTLSESYDMYDWGAGPGTDNSLTVNMAGDYSVTVTDANGCTGNTMISIVENTVDNLSISGGPSFCTGTSIDLTAVGNFDSYSWSTGATSAVAMVDMAGTYSVTATDINGCTNTAEIEIMEIPDPMVEVTGDLTLCPGGSDMVTLTATAGYTGYSWSNGESVSNEITIGTIGDYTVTVTDSNGCTNTASVTVTEDMPPPVSIDGNPTFCIGFTATLTATAGLSSYAWSNGEGTAEVEIDQSGTYTVTVTDANGCSNTAEIQVDQLSELMPEIEGELDICPGQAEDVVLTVAGTYATYSWGDDASGSDPTFTTNVPGTYTVSVTDADGCSGNSSITIVENIVDMVTISGGPSFCTGTSVDITAGGNFTSYEWSNGDNTATSSISSPGTFTVTATDDNGCSNTAEIEIIEIPDPLVEVTGDLTLCPSGGDMVSLTATAGYTSYEWSNGNTGSNEIMVGSTGDYIVTVTDENGCTNTAEVTVTEDPAPTVTIEGSPIFCLGFTTTLTATDGLVSYEWSNGELVNSIDVNISGTYTVTVTDANGCTNTAAIDVSELAELEPMIIGELDICPDQAEDVELTLSETYVSYEWGGDASGTDPTFTTNQAGTYSITVTDVNGCSGNSTITIVENIVDVVTISGGPTFCAGASVDLSASGNFTNYTWSTGLNSNLISVNTPGTYGVTATDDNGCTNTAEIEIIEIPDPMVEVTGDLTLCPSGGDMVVLTATAGYDNYAWSDGTSGSNEATISTPGDYTVTVTDVNGCTNSATVSVVEDLPPPVSIDGNLTFCLNFTTTLTATEGLVSYEWSSGETANAIEASASGTYTVTVTDINGCTNTADITVTQLTELEPNILGELDICPGQNEDVVLSTELPYTMYQWGGDATGSGPTLTINEAGTYSVTVTDDNGCSGNSTITVIENIVGDVTIDGPPSFCEGTSAGLFATSGWASYAWSDGASVFTTEVTVPGNYTVTVTDDNGCTNTAEFNIEQVPNPIAEITGDFDLCEGETETLDVGTWVAVLWSTGATESTIDVSTAGLYTATVTDDNGCTGTAEANVIVNPLPEPVITGDFSFCIAGSTTLTVEGNYVGIEWSTGESGESIVVSSFEDFAVTVTDENGCSNTAMVTTELQDGLTPEITGPDLVCLGSTIQLDAGEYLSYLWDDGSTESTLDVVGAGTFFVTVTDAGECTGVAVYAVSEAEPEAVAIAGSNFFCEGLSIELVAEGNHVAYEWSNGGGSSSIDVSEVGTYTVTATDANGCTATNEIEITSFPNPEPIIDGTPMFCIGFETVINVTEEYVSYEWSNGEMTQEVSIGTEGDYSVTVTDENGCTGIQTISISQFEELMPEIRGLFTFCVNGYTEISSGLEFESYEWSNGETSQLIQIGEEGTYSLTVTDEYGCSASTSVEVTQQDELYPEIENPGFFCEGEEAILDAGAGYVSYIWDDADETKVKGLTVVDPGVYTVTVTDLFGCTGTSSVEILELPNPEVEITGVVFMCDGETTELFATEGYDNYEWSPSGSESSILVDESGTYSVVVTDENGCTSEASIYVTVFDLPEPELWGLDLVCLGYTNTFEVVQEYVTYEWSTGETTQSIEYGETDIVFVTVTDDEGCTGVGQISQGLQTVNEAEIAGSTSYCGGGGTILDAGEWISYEWEGPVYGESQFIEANIEGEYTVYVTDYNGCTSSSSVYVEEGNELFPNVTGNFEFCEGGSAILNAGVFDSYQWSGPESGNEQIFEVTTPGNYTLEVMDGACAGTFDFEIEVFEAPIVNIHGASSICNGQPTELAINSTDDILWSTGANTAVISISQAGAYSVTVTDINGCTASSSIVVSSAEDPIIQISGDQFFCPGSSTTLVVGEFESYAWSNGGTTQSINVNQPGTVSVTVTDQGGCTGVGSVEITELIEEPVVISGSTTFCIGSSSNIDAGSGYVDYLWSTGETTQGITVDSPGQVTVTVTTTGGCVLSQTVNVTQETSLSFEVLGNTNICDGSSTILDAGNFDSYAWDTPEGPYNSQTIEVSTPGIYTVTVGDGNGCEGEQMVELFLIDVEQPEITGATTICTGTETTISVAGNYTSYMWSNGSTDQSINVSNPGTYNVTVTTAEGCMLNTQAVIEAQDLPVPVIIGATSFCPGSTVLLDAGEYASYSWSAGGTGQTIEIGSEGEIFVTVTDDNGCEGIASVVLTSNEIQAPQLAGSTSFCTNSSTTIEVVGDWDDIVWSNGETGSEIEIDSEGEFTVIVTDANGCTSMESISIIEDNNLAVNLVADNEINCDESTTVISAGGSFDGYQWSTGEDDASISVTEAGMYSVTVSDATGCTGIGTINIIDGTVTLPEFNLTAFICEGEDVTIGYTENYSSYEWSNGENTQFITIDEPGLYTITVSNALGCEATSVFSVSESDSDPVEINGDLLFCADGTTTLSADGYQNYSWNVAGETTSTLEVSTPGIYSVTATNESGCLVEGSIEVNNYPDKEMVIVGSTTYCAGSSTALNIGSDWVEITWSTGETEGNVLIAEAGLVSVTAIDEYGCEYYAEAMITEDTGLTPSITGNTVMCEGETVTLDAGAGYGYYEWNSGENSQTLEIDEAGTYTVSVVDASGNCSGEGSITVTAASIEEPVITAPASACPNEDIVISVADTYASYEWSNGATVPNPAVSGAGIYEVTVTNAGGCVASTSVEVLEEEIPSYTIDNIECAESGDTYSVIVTTDALMVSNDLGLNNEQLAPGQYLFSGIADGETVNITISNGITFCAETIEIEAPNCECPAIAIAGEDQTIGCQVGTITLDGEGSSTGSNISYEWIDASGEVISEELTVDVTEEGIYTLVVSDNDFDCMVSDQVFVSATSLPEPEIEGADEICEGTQTILSLSDEYENYEWSTGESSSSIVVGESGNYQVTITNELGCEAVAEYEVEVIDTPSLALSSRTCNETEDAYTIIFQSNSDDFVVEPNATIVDLGSNMYEITDIDISVSISITALNSILGCVETISVDPPNCNCEAMVDAGEDQVLSCTETSVSIGGTETSTGSDYSYEWIDSNGEVISDEATTEVTMEGTYTLIVTDNVLECENIDVVIVEMAQMPEPEITGETEICESIETTLQITEEYGTYTWSTGETTASISVDEGGIYEVTVTNAEGCEGMATFELVAFEIPSVNLVSRACNESEDEYNIVFQTNGENIQVEPNVDFVDLGSNMYEIAGIDINTSILISVSNSELECTETLSVDPPNCNCEANVDAGEDQILTCTTTSVTIGGSATSSGSDYSYEWIDPNGEVISNETTTEATIEGAYTLIVTDNVLGCENIDVVNIEVAPTPEPVISGMSEICEGTATSLTLDQAYDSYNWSTGESSASIIVDEGGVYLVTVTDDEGCEGMAEFEVNASEVPTINLIEKTCNEDDDEYTLVFESSSSEIEIDVNATVVDLGSNMYEISGIDISETINLTIGNTALDCSVMISFNPPNCDCEVLANAGSDQVLTCENPTATIGGLGSSAGSGISYEWIDPLGQVISTGLTAEAVMDGEYSFVVTNASLGCSATEIVFVDGSALPMGSISGDAKICESDEAILTVNDTYESYDWSNGDAGESITVTEGGYYQVTFTDAEGCQGVTGFVVELVEIPNIVVTDRFCNEDADEFTLVFQTEAADIDVNINNPVVDLGSNMYEITNIAIDQVVSITVSNSELNCSQTVTYEGPNCFCEVVADAGESALITCETESVILGGDLTTVGDNISYAWYDETGTLISEEQFIEVFEEGIYTFEVFDLDNDCSDISTVEVIDRKSDPLAIILSATDNVIDCQLASVELYVDAEDNTMYTWTTSEMEMNGTSINIENDSEVILMAVDTLTGCLSTDTVHVADLSQYPAIFINEPPILNCNNTEVIIGSGTMEFENDLLIEWFDENGNEVELMGVDSISVNEPGWYYVQATDEVNGCMNIDSVQVNEYFFEPAIEAGDDLFFPCDASELMIEALNVSIDTDREYDIVWTTDVGNIVGGTNDLNPIVNQEGTYFVQIMDVESGCIAMDSLYIEADENKPYGISSIVQDPFCSDEEAGVISVDDILGGNGPFNYTLNGDESSEDGIFENLASGTYDLLIEDANGCVHDTIIEIGFENEVNLYTETTILELNEGESEDVELITNLQFGEINSMEWNTTEGLSCTECLQPTVSVDENTDYVVTIYDENGCSATTTFRVLVENEPMVFAPNIITPEADDKLQNIRFTIYANKNVEIIEELYIYDRWGELMFSDFDFPPNRAYAGWDGTFKGKHVVPGVYVFIGTYRTITGETGLVKGDVTVVR